MNVTTLLEFKEAQDCESATVNGRLVFQNGATSDGITHHLPPTDEFERLKLQRELLQHKLDKEKKAFKSYRQTQSELAGNAAKYSNLPTADEEAPRLLGLGKERIDKLRDEIQAITARLDEQPASLHEAERQKELSSRSAEQRTLQRDIMSVTYD